MISAGDFKNGLTIEVEGNVYQIVEFISACKTWKGSSLRKNEDEEHQERRCC